MDGRIQASHISFRANEVLVVAVAERAQRSGCSVSEYLRRVVRERVGLR